MLALEYKEKVWDSYKVAFGSIERKGLELVTKTCEAFIASLKENTGTFPDDTIVTYHDILKELDNERETILTNILDALDDDTEHGQEYLFQVRHKVNRLVGTVNELIFQS